MTLDDPYAPPKTDESREDAEASDEEDVDEAPGPPTARLYSPLAVMLCGFFFGPVVGCGMAATNYARVGEARKAKQMWAVGIGCFLVILAIVAFFGDSPTLVRGAQIGGTVGLASSLRIDQKRLVDPHVQAGGAIDPPLVPIVAGVAFVAAVFAVAWMMV
jgi:hypothetical protein